MKHFNFLVKLSVLIYFVGLFNLNAHGVAMPAYFPGNDTICSAPDLVAMANDSSTSLTTCSGAITLSANESGGINCTGYYEYAWFNGSYYWDGNGFNLPVLSSAAFSQGDSIITITQNEGTTVNYTGIIRCSADTSCNNSSSITVRTLPVINDTINVAICLGQSYDGHTSSAIYTDTFKTVNGCDSIVTTVLEVVPLITDTIDLTMCQGANYEGYDTSGVYIDSFNVFDGCDSIRTLNLTIIPIMSDTVNLAICQGQTYGGHSFTGTFIDTLQSVYGCDSIRTLNLVVGAIIKDTITTHICQDDNYEGYTVSGVYIDTFHPGNTCDSIRTLKLTVDSVYIHTIKTRICMGNSYDGHTVSGNFTDTLFTPFGCDSIIILELEVDSVPDTPIILQQGNILTVYQAYYQYVWYKGDSTSTGDSSSSLVINANTTGYYYVQVFDSGSICPGNSTLFYAIYTGIESIGQGAQQVSIFPNPATDILNISVSGLTTEKTLEIRMYDATGKLILKSIQAPASANFETQLNLKDISTGLYLVQLQQDNWSANRKVLILK